MDYENYRKKRKMEEEDTTVYPTLPNNLVFYGILSRLPAELLMRLRSYCRLWNSTIKQDQYFIHLHFTQSIKRQKVFIEEPLGMEDPRNAFSVIKRGAAPHCFVIGDVEEGNCQLARASQIFTMSTFGLKGMPRGMTPFCYLKHPGAVNGLTCFRQYFEPYYSVCVFNVSTREVTPWLKSRVKSELKMDGVQDDLGFGYSPATKEHKLLWKWSTFHASDMNNSPQGNVKEVWEVLKVGQNTWRLIEDVLPFFVGINAVSTYVDETIYWLPESGDARYTGNLSLAAFDVGIEKFRKIEIIRFSHGPAWEDAFGVCTHLLEVDGVVAVLRRMNEDYVMLWKYHECNTKTTRELLRLPEKWAENCRYYFHTGFQINHVIVEFHQSRQRPRLFSCNMRNRNFFREIQAEDGDFPLVDDVPGSSLFTFFSENLLRLLVDVNATTVVIQMPDGSTIGRRFQKSDKLQSVFDFIYEKKRVVPGTYRLVRSFGHCESVAISLSDLGMTSKEEPLSIQLQLQLL